MSLLLTCNLRSVRELGLPAGYYGSAIFIPAATTTAGKLLASPLGDAVERIQEAKASVAT